MVEYYDLETFMNELGTVMKTQLPLYVAKMNTEKADSLLDVTDIANIYKLWSLTDLVPAPVSFLQYVAGNPKVSTQKGRPTALSFPIKICCFIQDTGDFNVPIIKARYNRIFLFIMQEILTDRFSMIDAETIDFDEALIQDEDGATYELASILFKANFVY